MIVVEVFLLSGIAAFGIFASISDFKYGKISNKAVVLMLTYALILDIIYYGIYVNDVIADFVLNNITVWIVIIVLYFSKTWAGGDCKLCFAISLMYPARLYLPINGSIVTLGIAVAFSFLLGYLYLVWDAVYCLALKRIRVHKQYVLQSLVKFLISYGTALLYITAVSILLALVFHDNPLPPPLQVLLYACIAWLVSNQKWFQNRYLLSLLFVAEIAFCLITHSIPVSSDFKVYIVMLFLLLMQILIRLRNYQSVPAVKIQARMILTVASSLLLSQTKIVSAGKISKENLGSRLTEEQAETIRNWGKGTKIELTIVRKVPFAVFIFFGFVLYFVVWSITL